MVKDYIPFIIFASVIAVFTLVFIIRGSMSKEDESDKSDNSQDEGDANSE